MREDSGQTREDDSLVETRKKSDPVGSFPRRRDDHFVDKVEDRVLRVIQNQLSV